MVLILMKRHHFRAIVEQNKSIYKKVSCCSCSHDIHIPGGPASIQYYSLNYLLMVYFSYPLMYLNLYQLMHGIVIIKITEQLNTITKSNICLYMNVIKNNNGNVIIVLMSIFLQTNYSSHFIFKDIVIFIITSP